MRIFDTNASGTEKDADKRTAVLYHATNFKIRIIQLPPGGSIPPCDMVDIVIFHVLSGSVEINSDGNTMPVKDGQGIVSEPSTISMSSKSGVRLLGIQIAQSREDESDE